MTPAELGYVKCARCGCWRPVAETVEAGAMEVQKHRCADAAVCSRLANVGKGELEGGAP